MAEPIFVAVWGTVVIGAIVLGVLTDKDRRLKRKLKKAPLRTIRHLPDQKWARFVGRVEPLESPLSAPLTGRACAFWRVVVEEKRGKSYSTVLTREQGKDFSIADETGRLLVRIAGAQLAVERDGKFSSGVWNDATPELTRFLEGQGEKTQGMLFNRTLRYYEEVIEAGESVAVTGVAHAEPDPNPDSKVSTGYRETPMRMVLQGKPEAPLLITDDPDVAKR